MSRRGEVDTPSALTPNGHGLSSLDAAPLTAAREPSQLSSAQEAGKQVGLRQAGQLSTPGAKLPGVLRTGFLYKHGGAPGSWTKRWFVAHVDGYVYHFITERDAKPRGSIPCHGALVRKLETQEFASEGFFGMAIVLNNKKRVLYAAAEAEFEPWIKAISRAARADGTFGDPQTDLPASLLALEEAGPPLAAAADGGERETAPSEQVDEREGEASYWQPLDEDPPGSAPPSSGGSEQPQPAALAAARRPPIGRAALSSRLPGAARSSFNTGVGGLGVDGANGQGEAESSEWEVDEEGFRVRKSKPPRPRRGRRAASEGGAPQGDDGWGSDGGEEGDEGDEGRGEEEEEFRPVIQICIKAAAEARRPSSAAELTTAAAALRSSSALLQPPRSRSRQLLAQPRLTHASSAPAQMNKAMAPGAEGDKDDVQAAGGGPAGRNGGGSGRGDRASSGGSDECGWGWAESLDFPVLQEPSPAPPVPPDFAPSPPEPARPPAPDRSAAAPRHASAPPPRAQPPMPPLCAQPREEASGCDEEEHARSACRSDASAAVGAAAARRSRLSAEGGAEAAAAASVQLCAGAGRLASAAPSSACACDPAADSARSAPAQAESEVCGASTDPARHTARAGSGNGGTRDARISSSNGNDSGSSEANGSAPNGSGSTGSAVAPASAAGGAGGAAAPSGQPATTVSLVQSALLHLEAGRYERAQQKLALCLRQLTAPAAAQPQPHGGGGTNAQSSSLLADVSFCARYHIAVSLLLQLARPAHGAGSSQAASGHGASGVGERARLSALLGALPLLPRHRRTCLGIAISNNLAARNYGLVAAFASALATKPLALSGPGGAAQREELARIRAECKQNGLENTDSVLEPCRSCGSRQLVSASECAVCGARVHVCCASHRVLTTNEFTWCRLCLCLFSPEVVPLGSNCRVCSTGVVIPGFGAGASPSG